MFLIEHRLPGMHNFVFTRTDPREEGFKGEVIEGVTLDYDMNAINIWPDGQPRPNPQLGRDPADPKHYKVFKFPEELQVAGFQLVYGMAPLVFYSWSEYCQTLRIPAKVADTMGEDEWFDYLEELEEATRLRRKKDPELDPPIGGNRDQIAEWIANRHLRVDGNIREIWYLPVDSPANEIRFLELIDRFDRNPDIIEPLDFGVEFDDTPYKLLVADITNEEWEMVKRDPALLPSGWRLDDARRWGGRK